MKFKIGDKVAAYNSSGRNTGIIDQIYHDRKIMRIHEKCYFSWYHEKQCRRIVKKPKFKKGDRVMVYYAMSEKKEKGTILDMCNDNKTIFIVKMDYDNREVFCCSELLKKLIKKKPKFKVGDRVVFYFLYGGKIKGTVIEISYHKDYLKVDFDGHPDGFDYAPISNIKKLIKKKPSFKHGDRVMVYCEEDFSTSKATVLTPFPHLNEFINVIYDRDKEVETVQKKMVNKLRKKKKPFEFSFSDLIDIL